MYKKISLGILFGGKSVEHEVSLQSARHVIESLDREKYAITLVGIDKEGTWSLYDEEDYLIHPDDPERISLGPKKESDIDPFQFARSVDVVFPVLHGTFGEDGTVQGLLKLTETPFVGAGVVGSSIGMDKDVMKRILRDAKIPIPHFLTIHEHERDQWPFERVIKTIPLPFFVKPSNGGSSIGISKVTDGSEFKTASDSAFKYDRKILIEEAIAGREIQCSLLGNEELTVSLPCEIIPKGEYHSYASKYIDPQGAEFIIPVEMEMGLYLKMRTLAIKTFKELCCEGMARIDMFLKPCGEFLINEINTLPGLTEMSPYAKMWRASGLSYSDMMDRLIQLALERHAKEAKLVMYIDLKDQWVIR